MSDSVTFCSLINSLESRIILNFQRQIPKMYNKKLGNKETREVNSKAINIINFLIGRCLTNNLLFYHLSNYSCLYVLEMCAVIMHSNCSYSLSPMRQSSASNKTQTSQLADDVAFLL